MKHYHNFSGTGFATLTETAQHWNFSLTGEMADYVRGFLTEKGVNLDYAINSFLDNEIETLEKLKEVMKTLTTNKIIDQAINELSLASFSGKAVIFPELSSVPWHTLRAIKQAFRDPNLNLIPSVINSPKAAIRIETLAIWLHTLMRIHDEDNRNFKNFFEYKIKYVALLHEEALALS